jgi:hypothetical protein
VTADPLALLGVLARHEVDFVVIGGVAVQAHGHLRTTRDVDVIAAPDADNARRLAAALRELDARNRGVDAEHLDDPPTRRRSRRPRRCSWTRARACST